MSEHQSHSQEDQVPHAKDSRTTPLDTPTQLSLVKMFRKRAVRLGYLKKNEGSKEIEKREK